LNYGWNESTFHDFVAAMSAMEVQEIDVWRQDMTPPPGTTAAIPPWFIHTLQRFLNRSI
jgi:hypothetical protein